MFQRSGSGFLGSALTTAAGVGGGILAADALMDLFGHRGGGGGLFGVLKRPDARVAPSAPPMSQGEGGGRN